MTAAPSPPESLCLLRLSALGDATHVVPLVRTLQRAWPATRLAWIIGNEPNLRYTNPKVFDAINDISKMIHQVDTNHPTTTALSGFSAELATLIERS